MGATLGIEKDGDGGVIVMETNAEYRGVWTATVYDGDKEYNEHGRCITPVLFEAVKENLIVTVGKQLVLDRLFGLGAVIALAGTAVGANSAAAAVGDTAATFTTPAYKVFASTPTRSNLVVTALTSYTTAEANINIQEAGLLTASAGILFNRVAPFLAFAKTTAVALDITTTVQQA